MSLPFTYMPLAAVLLATGIGSKSTLYARIREGRFPEPDHIDGSSRWRSDRISQWLMEQATKADSERAQRAQAAQARARRMVDGRRPVATKAA